MAEYIDSFQRAISNAAAKKAPTLDQNIKNAMAQKGVATAADRKASNLDSVLTQMEGLVSTGSTENVTAEKTFTQDFNAPRSNANNSSKKEISKEDKDAFELLKDVFRTYNLEELVPVIEGYMRNDVGPEQARIMLKQEQAYKDRFAGNVKRAAKGLNVLPEETYLALENDYNETLNAYGIGDYFGPGITAAEKKAKQANMAEVIGNVVSPLEFKDRVALVVNRVKNADKETQDAFKQFYGVDDKTLIKYFLGSAEGKASLEEKVKTAEISGARAFYGLGQSTLANAADLARLNIDKAAAMEGYAKIAEVLPRTQKIGEFYSEAGINYDVAAGEGEFLKTQAAPKEQRRILRSLERGSFSGDAGTSSQASSLTKRYAR